MATTIYRDAIGRPSSEATISVYGAQYGAAGTGGYLALSATSDAPSRRWDYLSHDVSHIVAEMESDGWQCVVGKDGYNAPIIQCTHIATQAVIDQAQKLSNDKFANAERGYIRFGKCPQDGRSINHRDNTQEAGVSVFEAEFVGKDYRLLVNNVLEVTYVSVMDRPAYRIYGEAVGTGADGEPVLRVTKSVKL